MYDYVLFVWCPKTKEFARYGRYDSMNALFLDLKDLVDYVHQNKFKIFKWKKYDDRPNYTKERLGIK